MSATATTLTESKDHRTVIRERHFNVRDYERVLLLIHESRATGTLMLDLKDGGIAGIRLREEQKIVPT